MDLPFAFRAGAAKVERIPSDLLFPRTEETEEVEEAVVRDGFA